MFVEHLLDTQNCEAHESTVSCCPLQCFQILEQGLAYRLLHDDLLNEWMRENHYTEDCLRSKSTPSFVGHGKAPKTIGHAHSHKQAGHASVHVGCTEEGLSYIWMQTHFLISLFKGASRRSRLHNLAFKDVCVLTGQGVQQRDWQE